ncbi:MAG: RHS repeat protein [Chitinophaga sp.]|uniref:RHS repeat protein n=1 Tax=Chitinophaga sp. TaxID=1869181 RepID=UPI0025BC0A1E|nr:RHS repeat domain-containing protein [Chitinophaga sp.]MBV8252019.1 RHS repeat protein [Chitinophaga sp.]
MNKNFITHLSLLLVFLGCNLNVVAQLELRKVIPLSPTAAEMQKYVDAPVNYFTGIPAISIPVYTIHAGDLSLPLSLSYHAGGNKVEGLSTWIGLSWSLGTLPSISRSVNGIPDETPGGAFEKFGNRSFKEWYDRLLAGGSGVGEYKNFLADMKAGRADNAPDIFSYNINGASGRFYYNQELNKFVTTPLSNVKISYGNNSFTIVGEDGIIYNFNGLDAETTGGNGLAISNPVTTTWMISSIQNSAKTETISFDYANESQINQSIVNETKFQFLSGEMCDGENSPPPYAGVSIAVVSTHSKRLTGINFRGGTVKFVAATTDRQDLIGSYALDSIIILNNRGEIIKQSVLGHKYLTSSGCNGSVTYRTNKWMLLSGYQEISSNKKVNSYSFEYEEFIVPPCRTSMAQDFWGFYNGKLSNNSLIPTVTITGTNNNAIVIGGADRNVDIYSSQFGILKKMVFPTGGYREFVYENNDAYSDNLPLQYKKDYAVLQSDYNDVPIGEENNLPASARYEVEFTVNNPPDKILNNNNPNGGAFLDGEIGELGVPPGTAGANVYIQRKEGPPYFGFAITYPFSDHYIPNGTYVLTAVFNQNPPNYQNFYVLLSWKVIDKSKINSYAGGLRIREIKTFENAGSIPLTEKYRYTVSPESDTSSGDIFSDSRLNYADKIDVSNVKWDPVLSKEYTCEYTVARLQSFSTQQQVNFAGSLVGYKNVYVTTSAPEQTGMTNYTYTYARDINQYGLPYPPPISAEDFRGQLKSKKDYQFKNNKFQLVKSVDYDYDNRSADDLMTYGIKTDPEAMVVEWVNKYIKYPVSVSYTITPTWSAVSSKTERVYDLEDASKVIEIPTTYLYNDHQHVKEVATQTSNGELNRSVSFYPYELTLTGSDEIARQALLSNNILGVELKKENYLSSRLLSAINSNFQLTPSGTRARSIEMIRNNANDGIAMDYISYDVFGNILQQRKRNDVMEVYVWGYSNLYPVAKILGSDYNTVSSFINPAILNDPATTDAAMRAELDKIRKGLANTNAQVFTYTYKPLFGITSETDARGNITTYEYDEFGRLLLVRDKEGNILKKMEYVLKQQ